MNTQDNPKPIPFIRELCEHKTELEILEAEENFRSLLRVFDHMYARLESEKEEPHTAEEEALLA